MNEKELACIRAISNIEWYIMTIDTKDSNMDLIYEWIDLIFNYLSEKI
jgi:hypothetical protein